MALALINQLDHAWQLKKGAKEVELARFYRLKAKS
jgi:hypothetical protein